MLKKISPVVVLIVLTIVAIIAINNNQNKLNSDIDICKVENCDNVPQKENLGHGIYNYSDYCEEHTCQEDGCQSEKNSSDTYCSFHAEQQAINEEKSLKLTNQQINEAKKVVDQYCRNLMSKHSYIGGINIINDTPETTETLIMFRCNVVRDDSNVNLATIYVKLQDDGTFKVDELKYDK